MHVTPPPATSRLPCLLCVCVYSSSSSSRARALFVFSSPTFNSFSLLSSELNFIERYWGRAKCYVREHCDYSLSELCELSEVALGPGNCDLTLMRRYARTSWRWMDAYSKGLSGPSLSGSAQSTAASARRSKGASTRGRNRKRKRRELKRRGSWACGVKGNSKATSNRHLNFSHSPLTQPVAP